MNHPHNSADIYTTVDDELYEELTQLADQLVVYVEVWEDSLADALSEAPPIEVATTADIDLYLADGAYFELYGVLCLSDLDGDPLQGAARIKARLVDLVRQQVRLIEVAVDEEDALVLVLGREGKPLLYLAVAGWLIDEWDELPDG